MLFELKTVVFEVFVRGYDAYFGKYQLTKQRHVVIYVTIYIYDIF